MTNLQANSATVRREPAAKRSLGAQWADLKARYASLPRRQQWVVLAAIALLGWFLADAIAWQRAAEWAAESDQIEAALARGAGRQATVTTDLKRNVATYGGIEVPGEAAQGREELARAINDIAKKHKVAGYSYEARTGQRMKDPEASVLGGVLERLQAEVKFETTPDALPRIIDELESHPGIETISSLRLTKNEQARKVTVQATVEAWVVGGSRGAR
jgi:hypothetical protein